MFSIGLPPWIPPSLRARVDAYRRELEQLRMGALRRELRDARSDRLILRHMREGVAFGQQQIDRLVGFYVRALGGWSEEVEAKLLRDQLRTAAFRSEWSQYLNREPLDVRARTIKVWRTRRDDKVRDAHDEMEGRALPFDQPYATPDGGYQWGPRYAYNCRCWVSVHVLDNAIDWDESGAIIVPKGLVPA